MRTRERLPGLYWIQINPGIGGKLSLPKKLTVMFWWKCGLQDFLAKLGAVFFSGPTPQDPGEGCTKDPNTQIDEGSMLTVSGIIIHG